MKFEDFCTHELRKVLQGKFQGRAYFIRCVRDWDEVEEKYGCFKYRRVGKARVSAVVSNDSESILTPCIYGVQDVRVLYGKKLSPRRLLSYRGRFCEQARTGERIIAFGELEQVVTESDMYYQLVVGESMHDFILSM
jgi:predicted nucleotidyltransferase